MSGYYDDFDDLLAKQTAKAKKTSKPAQPAPSTQGDYDDELAKQTAKAKQVTMPTLQLKAEYAYPSKDAYDDLRANVSEVGYSGLDDAQKKLFQSQFPASKFARAGGSFEDAIKYVDNEARLSKPMSVAEISPLGGMFGAVIPMTPPRNDKAVEYAKDHPAETAVMAASIPFAPETGLGALLLGAGAGSARAVDKLHPFTEQESDYKTMTPADNTVDIGSSGVINLIGGLGSAGLARIGKGARDITSSRKAWAASEAAKDEALQSAQLAREAEIRAVNRFADRASKSNAANDVAVGRDPDLGRISYKYFFNELRDRVANYIEHTDPRYFYGNSRYGMKPTPEDVATFIEALEKPIVREKAALEPKGWDLTAMLPNNIRVPLSEAYPKLANNYIAPKLAGPVSDVLSSTKIVPGTTASLEAYRNSLRDLIQGAKSR